MPRSARAPARAPCHRAQGVSAARARPARPALGRAPGPTCQPPGSALTASAADQQGPLGRAVFPASLYSTQRPRQFRRDPRRVSAGHARPRCPGPLLNGPAAPAPPPIHPRRPRTLVAAAATRSSKQNHPPPPVSFSSHEFLPPALLGPR